MCLMSEEKKFQIVYSNKKTKEAKIETIEKLTFQEVASHAFGEVKKLFERTGDTWEIVGVYKLDYKLDYDSCMT